MDVTRIVPSLMPIASSGEWSHAVVRLRSLAFAPIFLSIRCIFPSSVNYTQFVGMTRSIFVRWVGINKPANIAAMPIASISAGLDCIAPLRQTAELCSFGKG